VVDLVGKDDDEGSVRWGIIIIIIIIIISF
jgi:hypothetical protein